jgi:hypothetical protein
MYALSNNRAYTYIGGDFHGKTVCYVEFAKLSSAQTVIYNMKKIPFRINGKVVKVNYAVDIVDVGKPSRLLWVTGLDMSMPLDLVRLKRIFDKYGEVENIIPSASPYPINDFLTQPFVRSQGFTDVYCTL